MFADLLRCVWRSLECLHGALYARAAQVHDRHRCPVTGTTIAEAHRAERALLQAVPSVQEPFDCVVARRVTRDCLVSFEGRRYSVPFASVGRVVEVRGTAQHVVIVADGHELARHARHTAARLVLVATHYEGESTATVRAPTPLGRRAQLQLATMPGLPTPATVARPLSAYIALVEDVLRQEVGR
jgi:hypothetical protein